MVAHELKAAGINASFQGISVDAWNADMATGNFQLSRALVEQRPDAIQPV